MNEKTNESVEIKSELNETPKPGLEFDEAQICNDAIKQMKLGVAIDSAYIRGARWQHQQSSKALEAANKEIERCREIAERDGKDYSDLKSQLESAMQMIAILEKALKKYADKETWGDSKDKSRATGNKCFDICLFDFDRSFEKKKDYAGAKAREALASLSEWRKTQAGKE